MDERILRSNVGRGFNWPSSSQHRQRSGMDYPRKDHVLIISETKRHLTSRAQLTNLGVLYTKVIS